ncbi:MAG: hypothetical protein ACI9GW_002197 [Halieaceae bacterium]
MSNSMVDSAMDTNDGWGDRERAEWLAQQLVQRSYAVDVIEKITPLGATFLVQQYGTLLYEVGEYPLFIVRTRDWNESKATVLITGGVHGYETSGVHGAIRFLETEASAYSEHFNFVVAPCVSPWGYETINRWNPAAVDPNRSFVVDSPAQEAAALMKAVAALNVDILAHFDLHETTDTDESVFGPALAARDGKAFAACDIPDGFYAVGDTENSADDFQQAIISAVRKVTHIAPPDLKGDIIGEPITQEGVINYAIKELGLCAGFSNCEFATTTEVYPDSPKVNDEDCIIAQVAAVKGGLEYLIKKVG